MKDKQLSEELRAKALRFAADLKKAREAGRVTVSNPIRASKVCRRYRELYEWDLTPRDIRRFVHWLREKKISIGSSPSGYWYIGSREGLEVTKRHLRSRLGETAYALRGLERSMSNLDQEELFKDPKMGFIIEELGLERV